HSALSGIRLWLISVRDSRFENRKETWRKLLSASIVACGLAWGLFGASANYTYTSDATETILVTISVLGVTISILPVLASELMTRRLYFGAALGPVIATNLATWDRGHLGMAAAVLLFLVFLLEKAGSMNAEYWKNVGDHILLQQRARELDIAKRAAEAAS